MGASEQRCSLVHRMKHNNQIHSCRNARDKKAALVAPRPVAGNVRPVVHGSTLKYNSKVRNGRGFSLAEIKDAGLGKLEAQSLGISVDARRRNRSVNGKQANVQRLREYRANLVVFPRNGKNKLKKGWKDDSAAAETETATQLTTQFVMRNAKATHTVETRKITEEEKNATTTRTLKAAWNDARLVGFRENRAKARAEKAEQDALKKKK